MTASTTYYVSAALWLAGGLAVGWLAAHLARGGRR